jgi:hypothetical protein
VYATFNKSTLGKMSLSLSAIHDVKQIEVDSGQLAKFDISWLDVGDVLVLSIGEERQAIKFFCHLSTCRHTDDLNVGHLIPSVTSRMRNESVRDSGTS